MAASWVLWPAVLLAVGAQSPPSGCEAPPGAGGNDECDPAACASNPFLTLVVCKHRGIPATIFGFEPDPLWKARLLEFNRCTGAHLSITYNGPDGQGDEDSMAGDLLDDIGANGLGGAGIFDGYVVQPPWLPEIYPGLESLSPRIAEANAYVRWLDVNAPSRQVTRTKKN